jgi:hypothetical protein
MRKMNLQVVFVLAALFSVVVPVEAQNNFNRGLHVEVAFEGWEQQEDGSFDMYFGYHNENWEEMPTIPVGNNNFFSPGEIDRGQPTFFHPRRNRFVFIVNVAADFSGDLVWSLTSPNGETRMAYGSLMQDYVINKDLIQSETGAFGGAGGSADGDMNQPPTLTVLEGRTRQARVNEPVVLLAHVTDDGYPQTRRGPSERSAESEWERITRAPMISTVNKVNGLHMSWIVYRADDGADGNSVKFVPDQVKTWEDTRPSNNSPWSLFWVPPEVPADGLYRTEVTFTVPGTYVLKARADDGGLFDDDFVTFEVRGDSQAYLD